MRQTVCLFALSFLVNLNDVESRKTYIYDDMGCKAIKTNPNDKHPAAYDCDHIFEDGGCWYKDKKFEVGEVLPQSTALLSCSSSCRCKQDGFFCSVFWCPERGQVTLPSNECHHVYTLNECCNRGYTCPPFDNVPTCVVDGKTYFEGQKFFPNNTNYHCVCQNKFKGEYVMPFCRKIECGIQVKYKNEIKNRCAPKYEDTEMQNCPSSWICPDEENSDVIKNKNNQNQPLKCLYGKNNLNLGEYFERSEADYLAREDKTIKCKCVVPPLLTCSVAKRTPWKK